MGKDLCVVGKYKRDWKIYPLGISADGTLMVMKDRGNDLFLCRMEIEIEKHARDSEQGNIWSMYERDLLLDSYNTDYLSWTSEPLVDEYEKIPEYDNVHKAIFGPGNEHVALLVNGPVLASNLLVFNLKERILELNIPYPFLARTVSYINKFQILVKFGTEPVKKYHKIEAQVFIWNRNEDIEDLKYSP